MRKLVIIIFLSITQFCTAQIKESFDYPANTFIPGHNTGEGWLSPWKTINVEEPAKIENRSIYDYDRSNKMALNSISSQAPSIYQREFANTFTLMNNNTYWCSFDVQSGLNPGLLLLELVSLEGDPILTYDFNGFSRNHQFFINKEFYTFENFSLEERYRTIIKIITSDKAPDTINVWYIQPKNQHLTGENVSQTIITHLPEPEVAKINVMTTSFIGDNSVMYFDEFRFQEDLENLTTPVQETPYASISPVSSYPNPVSSEIFFKNLDKSNVEKINIYDSQFKLVQEFSLKRGRNQSQQYILNSDLSNGIYYYQIIDATNYPQVGRFILTSVRIY